MSLKTAILGLASYKELSGYDISKFFDSSLKYFFSAQQSQVYRELNTLEKKGLLSVRLLYQDDKPNKKLYSITEDGSKELEKWLLNFNEEKHFAQKLPLMMKIFFSSKVPTENLQKTFERVIELTTEKMKRLEHDADNIKDYEHFADIDESETFYWKLTIDYGLRLYKMYLEWAEHSIQLIEELQNNKNG
ncbi:hypothetical protein SH1V18_07240 [Vallitalea longa]|uniref:PadR family transcriptional regulator n=1 Tax=Vallitalea longa TaxID=2936439 RepID=A0A9W5Y869_9FIRM|nr:PadR family transcriptional regulator [Vallitalea longa]GKX28244.1 hypothetical protein SH1V18_07240 [Vallitalea longa]